MKVIGLLFHRTDQLLNISLPNDLTPLNDRHTLAEFFRLFQIMCGEQNGFSFLTQLCEVLPHTVAQFHVHTGGGFVQNNQLRVVDEGARNHEATFHSTRKHA